jgi:hypothetical protein
LPNPLLALRNLTLKGWRRASSVHKPFVRGARRRARQGEQDLVTREVAGIEQELAAIAGQGRPIVAGPWLAEVGYEALYWAPFLRWYQDAYRIPRDRLTILSRGGTHDWYADFAGGYVEIFDLLTPEALRQGNDARRAGAEGGGRKQSSASPMDDELVRLTRARHKVGDAVVLHPSLMFRLFRHVWHDALPYDYFWTHTRYRLIGGPDGPPLRALESLPDLPPDFSVAKFYSGVAMPPDPATRSRLPRGGRAPRGDARHRRRRRRTRGLRIRRHPRRGQCPRLDDASHQPCRADRTHRPRPHVSDDMWRTRVAGTVSRDADGCRLRGRQTAWAASLRGTPGGKTDGGRGVSAARSQGRCGGGSDVNPYSARTIV